MSPPGECTPSAMDGAAAAAASALPGPSLADALIVVVGLGGVGSHCAHGLLRAGARNLRLVDFDRVSLSSLNRHAVATRRDVGTSKVVACAAAFGRIAPGMRTDARDEMFTAEAAAVLLEAEAGGARPAMVIDCIDDVNTKADLLEFCLRQGLTVISALGSGAKGDPCKLCVARGLRDVVNDALGSKLRQTLRARGLEDATEVTFVYSSEKAVLELLPLSEEQRSAPEAFGNVANFRLRVIPVLGSQPALAGLAIAAHALGVLVPSAACHSRPRPTPKHDLISKYLEKFRKDEALRAGGRFAGETLTHSEALVAVHEVWQGRSAFDDRLALGCPPGQKFALAVWDRRKPIAVSNVVYVTDREAKAHTGVPEEVASEVRDHVEARLRWAACFATLPGGVPAQVLRGEGAPVGTGGGLGLATNGITISLCERLGAARQTARRELRPPEADAEEAALLVEQLSRSAAYFGEVGQAKVRASFVVIVGLGSVGASAAVMLCRSGVRRMRLVDAGVVECALHQDLATAADVGRLRIEACARELVSVRSDCEVETCALGAREDDSSWLAPWQVDSQIPDLVVDCMQGVEAKAAIVRACAARSLMCPVVTAVGWAGVADLTRLATMPLAECHRSPAACALRLAMGGGAAEERVSVIVSEEAMGWARPSCNTLNTSRAGFGFAAAAVALKLLSGSSPPPPPEPAGGLGGWRRLEEALRKREREMFGVADYKLDIYTVGFIKEELWHGRCALSGQAPHGRAEKGFCLTRWDRSRAPGLANLVYLSDEDAEIHDAATAATGSLPAPLLKALAQGREAGSEAGNRDPAVDVLIRVNDVFLRLDRHLAAADDDAATASYASARPAASSGVSFVAVAGATGLLAAASVGLAFNGKRRTAMGLTLIASAAAAVNSLTRGSRMLLRMPGADKTSEAPAVQAVATSLASKLPGQGFAGLIGATPLVEIGSLSRATGCRIVAKAEFLNPGGCQKDRVAKRILEEAEAAGLLRPGGTVVEGTSGSTGISLSLMAASRGFRTLIVMPDDQAAEKYELLRQFGAEVEQVRPASIISPEHYVNVARRRAAELCEQHGKGAAFFADQFENPANFRAHYHGTGPELWLQTGGQVDAFVMSSGTGGTLAGVGTYLKSVCSNVQVCLADVQGSSLYSKVNCGVLFAAEQAERTVRRHRRDTIAEGIGIDRLTGNMALGLSEHNGGQPCVDVAMRVSDQEALEMAHHLLRHDGLFVGSSAAVNCAAAVKVARALGPGKVVATVLCDSGLRHLTKFYSPEAWTDYGLEAPVNRRAAEDLSFVS